MKKIFSLLMAATLLLSIAACSRDTGASSQTDSSIQEPISQSSAADETLPSSNAVPETSTDQMQNTQTAVFALGPAGQEEKTMRVGDSIGEWTLEDLEIEQEGESDIEMLEALFGGEVTLKGAISRSGLVEDGFDFRVAEEDKAKMPYYVSPDMVQKDEVWFMLNLPDDIADALVIEDGGQIDCTITVSDYRFIFAYMMAPASATVISIEQ